MRFRDALGITLAVGTGAIVVMLALSADAATVNDTLDSDRAIVNAELSRLPDGGCVVSGCVALDSNAGISQTRGCARFELSRAANRNACVGLLDAVNRRVLAGKGFALDAGE